MLKKVFNTTYSWALNRIIVALVFYDFFVIKSYSEDVDVLAPMTTLKKSREAAAQANISQDSFITTLTTVGNILFVGSAAIGIGCCVYSGFKLFKNVMAGDNSRESNGSYMIAFGVGAFLTIVGAIIGIITNLVIK